MWNNVYKWFVFGLLTGVVYKVRREEGLGEKIRVLLCITQLEFWSFLKKLKRKIIDYIIYRVNSVDFNKKLGDYTRGNMQYTSI